MHGAKIRFTQSFGQYAKIEGSAACGDTAVEFELAMTECLTGPVKGVLRKAIAFRDLEDVKFKRRYFIRPTLIFSAASLTTFESLPGAKGYEYTVTPIASRQAVRSFLTDVRLAIAQATMEGFARQIEDSIG